VTGSAADKAAARAAAAASEAALSPEYLQKSAAGIVKNFAALPEYAGCGELFCFLSVGREVPTMPLIEMALAAGKTVALPVSLPGGKMFFRRYMGRERLEKGLLGIMTPDGGCPVLIPGPDSIAAVPGLCFDGACRRLGRGGGYYDRWLARHDIFSAGLCREALVAECVPAEEHDRPVRAVVTESRIIRA
jgi:5-formyltetrahydrofolate cyclo-ligase